MPGCKITSKDYPDACLSPPGCTWFTWLCMCPNLTIIGAALYFVIFFKAAKVNFQLDYKNKLHTPIACSVIEGSPFTCTDYRCCETNENEKQCSFVGRDESDGHEQCDTLDEINCVKYNVSVQLSIQTAKELAETMPSLQPFMNGELANELSTWFLYVKEPSGSSYIKDTRSNGCTGRNEICSASQAPCNSYTSREQCETGCTADSSCTSYEWQISEKNCQLSTSCTLANKDDTVHTDIAPGLVIDTETGQVDTQLNVVWAESKDDVAKHINSGRSLYSDLTIQVPTGNFTPTLLAAYTYTQKYMGQWDCAGDLYPVCAAPQDVIIDNSDYTGDEFDYYTDYGVSNGIGFNRSNHSGGITKFPNCRVVLSGKGSANKMFAVLLNPPLEMNNWDRVNQNGFYNILAYIILALSSSLFLFLCHSIYYDPNIYGNRKNLPYWIWCPASLCPCDNTESKRTSGTEENIEITIIKTKTEIAEEEAAAEERFQRSSKSESDIIARVEAAGNKITKNWGGNVYYGQMKGGDWHGYGTLTYANGNKYVGEYKNGKKDGTGTETKPDGTIQHSGEWKNGQIEKKEKT